MSGICAGKVVDTTGYIVVSKEGEVETEVAVDIVDETRIAGGVVEGVPFVSSCSIISTNWAK